MNTLATALYNVEETFAKFLVPHHRNNHHPYLIRHYSLFVISAFVLSIQLFSNVQAGRVSVLGFATSIFKDQVITLTNQERQKNGAGEVAENTLLDQAATAKAKDMFAKDYWAHFAPDGTSPWYFFNQVGYKYVWAGENLARDFQTSEGVVQGWMNSPSHRENLLNKNYKDIGIGVANGTLQGEETTLVVQLFGTQASSTTALGKTSTAPPPSNPKGVNDQLILGSDKETGGLALTEPKTKVSSEFTGNLNPLDQIMSLSWAARLELFLLLTLFVVFVIDTVVLSHKNIHREGSHSLVHAIVIGIVIVSIFVSSTGKLI